MILTILGSGTHIPVKNRSNPAYLLDIGGECLLIDCGSGTMRQIAKANRSEWEISKIFLSHLHIDHTMDLIPMFFTFKYQSGANQKSRSLPIYAHPQFLEMQKNLEIFYDKWTNGEKRQYKHFPILSNQTIEFEKFKVDTFAANHAEHSIIFRFVNNKNQVFVYSGDTSPTEELIRAAYSADLLLIESTSPENREIEGHLSAKDIKDVIIQSKPAKTVITHLHPENDNENFIKQFEGLNVEVAEDLQIFYI